MERRVAFESSFAIAEAVKMADIDVCAAYPITPQTHIVERVAQLVANGELDANYVPVESEHSALSACLGSSAAGGRTFIATAGQGLELMHEVVYVASGMRLPIVMSVCNRALSAPLSIWGDHSDVMSVRDTGWIQIFAENAQQAFDLTLCAFHIAEDPAVLLPTMIHIDGFHLSHVIEPVLLPEQEKVTEFLPKYHHPFALDVNNPVAMGDFALPDLYTEAKVAHDMALRNSLKVILQVWQKFGEEFGREYSPVETYGTEDADILLLTMGSFSEVAMETIDRLKKAGEKVGLVRLRLWRPFPFEQFRQTVGRAKLLIVLDRALSVGGPGPVCSEVQAALYHLKERPQVIGFIGGLGGRDISVEGFQKMIHRGMDKASQDKLGEIEVFDVREK